MLFFLADSIAGTRKRKEKKGKEGKRRETKGSQGNLGKRKGISGNQWNVSNLN